MSLLSGSGNLPASLEFIEDFRIQFDEEQRQCFYLPLAGRLIDKAGGLSALIEIAGPPGSGKTTFTRLLAATIDRMAGLDETAVAIGMDGWHFPNTYLETHFSTIDEVRIPLKNIKGAPPTFDLESFIAFIHAVRQGEIYTYPIYNRKCHDPIPDAGKISPHTRFFLIEGNYLHLALPGWSDVAEVFDWRIFIDAPTPILRTSLRMRHLRGGKEPAKVAAFIEEVDLKNAALVRENRLPADVEIIKKDEIRIGEIHYLENPSTSSPSAIPKPS